MSELEDGFAIVRGLIDDLERRADQEPELVRNTIVRVVATLRAHGRLPKKAGNNLAALAIRLTKRRSWQACRITMVQSRGPPALTGRECAKIRSRPIFDRCIDIRRKSTTSA